MLCCKRPALGGVALGRSAENLRRCYHYHKVGDAQDEEGGVQLQRWQEQIGGNRPGNRCSSTKPGDSQAGNETPPVREPFNQRGERYDTTKPQTDPPNDTIRDIQ